MLIEPCAGIGIAVLAAIAVLIDGERAQRGGRVARGQEGQEEGESSELVHPPSLTGVVT